MSKPPTSSCPLDPQERRELGARAACHDRSILKAYAGERLRASAYHRIRRAALDLALPPPPPPSTPFMEEP